MINDKQFYAYYDAIEETGEVVYCGKGTSSRSDPDYQNHQRNKKYNSLKKKHKLVRTRIPTLDQDLAFKLEDWLMEYYHTWVDDPLCGPHACNIMGPGTNDSGKRHSQESIEKNRQAHLGKISPQKGKTYIELYGEKEAQEKCKKISKKRKDKKNPKHGDAIRGKKHSEERRKQKSEYQKGGKRSQETKDRMKLAQQKYYEEHEVTQETRDKISAAQLGKPKINKRKPIVKCDLNDNEIEKYESMTQAAVSNNVAMSLISLCCHNKAKQAYGFKWKFLIQE